jgi:hypothetical protein
MNQQKHGPHNFEQHHNIIMVKVHEAHTWNLGTFINELRFPSAFSFKNKFKKYIFGFFRKIQTLTLKC